MRLSKERLAVGVAGAGIILLLLLTIIASQRSSAPDARQIAIGQKATPTPPVAKGSDTAPSPASKSVGDPNYEAIKQERQRKLADVATTPINFFGKVVDEHGRPVVGATTHYIIGSLSFYGSPTRDGPLTDEDGRFAIIGHQGPDTTVWVQHPDYHRTATAEQRFEYARREYSAGKRPPRPPTEDDPAIFVLQKKGAAAELVTQMKELKLPMDGSAVAFDLRDGKVGQSDEYIVLMLNSTGDKLPLNEFRPFDWALTVQVPKGGLIERVNELAFEAPSIGYQPSITFSLSASLAREQWKPALQRDFFLSFASGRYAILRLNVSGENGRSSIVSHLNPKASSRNLEYEPAAQAAAR